LDNDEIKKVFCYNYDFHPKYVDQVIEAIDEDKNGVVDFNEF